jgi:type VI protein secretion system component VasF
VYQEYVSNRECSDDEIIFLQNVQNKSWLALADGQFEVMQSLGLSLEALRHLYPRQLKKLEKKNDQQLRQLLTKLDAEKKEKVKKEFVKGVFGTAVVGVIGIAGLFLVCRYF